LATILVDVNLDDRYVVNVHQAQTLDPKRFLSQELSFEQAEDATADTVAMLGTTVDHLKDQGKQVYVLGISVGAFLTQELLATQGNTADGDLIMVGRLNLQTEFWQIFAAGRTAAFIDGTEIIFDGEGEGGMGAGTPEGDVNMARLAASVAQHRYTERLADTDLSNVIYVYGTIDDMVGHLNPDEVAFLEDKGVRVEAYEGDHGGSIDAKVTEGLRALLGENLVGLPGSGQLDLGSSGNNGSDDQTGPVVLVASATRDGFPPIPDLTPPTGPDLLTSHDFGASYAAYTGGFINVAYGQIAGGVILAYAVGRWATPRRVVLGALLVPAFLVVGGLLSESEQGPESLVGQLPWPAITLVARYRATLVEEQRRHLRLAERHNLARDLHDTVAQHVSAIAVQAQAGRFVMESRPEAARQALEAIEATAGTAIDEMRRVVGILRHDDDAYPLRSPRRPGATR